ncbi:hypothetical protein GE09DRAFT_1160167 [Coniochaeta sp. 2T2.1]|nr:hypothetical protein GE09DRAFT_1160167 [Coniochaeta sp. 2T2.1]
MKPELYNPDDDSRSSQESEDAQLIASQPPLQRRRERRRAVWLVAGAVLIILTYTPLVVFLSRRSVVEDVTFGGRIIRSPAADYVKKEVREVNYLDWEESAAFFGKPSKEVDRNWHELVRYHNIGIEESYMQALNRIDQSVKFPDGRYYGSMMVYHHLHCLKHIYHALHPDHYPDARATAGHEDDFQKHTEHCLGALKAYIMCKADVTIETMLWSPKHSLPLHNVTSTHQCVRWDSIEEYARRNNEDVFADGMLVHPVYGAVYKDRKPVNVF